MNTPFRPKLPPKAGYVEVEINGVRQYQRVLTEAEQQTAQENAERDMLSAEHEMRLLLLEFDKMGGGI